MIEAPIPEGEAARLAVLEALHVLNTAPEPLADAFVTALAAAFDAPIAAITLVDADRQWFKASIGLGVRETPRAVSFCGHTILHKAPLVVPNAQIDARFYDNPLVVGAPHIRFYAGCPIRIDGQAIGALCVIDHKPRCPAPEQQERLEALGIATEAWLATRSQLRAPIDHLIRSLRSMSA